MRWVKEANKDVHDLAAAFTSLYGAPPVAVARAPGRVNIIGEHIDYMGYGVLPMAIRQACLVAISWGAGCSPDLPPGKEQALLSMSVSNVEQQLFPSATLQLADGAECFPNDTHPWLRYIHAAYKGCVEFAAGQGCSVPRHGEMQLLVQGTVPQGSGLSSSSALVVSSALALLALWNVPASTAQVAEFTCRCERFVGTQGGGMDQAASLMAQAQVALLVEFNPLRTHSVCLPSGGVFVVANCLAPSHKAETASTRFNKRVLECRLAAMLLAKQLAARACAAGDGDSSKSMLVPHYKDVKVLQELEQHCLLLGGTGMEAPSISTGQQKLDLALQQLLPYSSYSLQQVADQLGTPQPELLALLPPALQAAAVASTDLLLQQRARHVYNEAWRVRQFKAVCEQSDSSAGEKLVQLGALMDASHASCAGLYQCSCEELDQLVATAKAAGALGARLTGAGWGGCVVALVCEAQVEAFMADVKRKYFDTPHIAARLQETQQSVSQCLFETAPCEGASLFSTQGSVPVAK